MSFFNHGLNGEFKGYCIDDLPQTFWLGIFPKRLTYHVIMAKDQPLYFVDHLGRKFTTRREYESDFASIPPPFDRIWSPSEFRRSGMIHDDGCKNEGLWQIMDLGVQVFVPMTRLEMDVLMEEMACCECKLLGKGKVFTWITKHCVYAGVRIGAWFGEGKPNKKPPKGRIDVSKLPIAFA